MQWVNYCLSLSADSQTFINGTINDFVRFNDLSFTGGVAIFEHLSFVSLYSAHVKFTISSKIDRTKSKKASEFV